MKLQWMMSRLSFVRVGLLLLILTFMMQGQAHAEAGSNVTTVEPTEMYLVAVDGPNLTGEVPPLDKTKATALLKPTEMYLVPVDGPNLTGEVPPLNRAKAIPLHETSDAMIYSHTPGAWYDHYAYYTLDGTEVKQYTNFQETNTGQYIWLQKWENNNGGPARYLKDGRTGYTYNWFDTWLSHTPTLNPGYEYTEGDGTRLQTSFRTNSSSCPCWSVEYSIGTH
jgi:hypothetical protein